VESEAGQIRSGTTPMTRPSRIEEGSATTAALATLVLLAGLFFLALMPARPPAALPANSPADQFSAMRALARLQEIAAEPHPLRDRGEMELDVELPAVACGCIPKHAQLRTRKIERGGGGLERQTVSEPEFALANPGFSGLQPAARDPGRGCRSTRLQLWRELLSISR
jgi:hypothetical protein